MSPASWRRASSLTPLGRSIPFPFPLLFNSSSFRCSSSPFTIRARALGYVRLSHSKRPLPKLRPTPTMATVEAIPLPGLVGEPNPEDSLKNEVLETSEILSSCLEENAPFDDEDDDLDENKYLLTTNPEKNPRQLTEKKRREDAAFQSWLEKNQRQVTRESKERLVQKSENTPVGSLAVNYPNRKIIASPREYQIELFERAKEKNTIVVLETGSGKTLIAALLLRHILEEELEHRDNGQAPKTAFFVVEKVALCFQQHTVLSCNLELPIGKFYGEMTGVSRTKAYWDQQFADNMAVVCTAQILLDLLNSGFIRMNQINLLIFDEAHHTKKNHPYARIMKSHYLQEPTARPRILGMTASPVDAKTDDVCSAAMTLEAMLCSTIATVSCEVLFQNQAHRQQIEIKECYAKLQLPEESQTALWHKIAAHVGNNAQFHSHLEFAQAAASSLGPWCADRYWQLLMTDAEISRLVARTGRDFTDHSSMAEADKAMDSVEHARTLVQAHNFTNITPMDGNALSTKVNLLYEILLDAFLVKGVGRCIVFVQTRYTAVLLADLFKQPKMQIRGMRASFMIGTNAAAPGIINMSHRDQILTLQSFRNGDSNCLFATSVAEEGIDIPECDIVVRFDLYTSAIQYIQSKGRARKSSSLYVSMVEEGNMDHLRRLMQTARDTTSLRKFCSRLPEDRKVDDFTLDVDAIAKHEQISQKIHVIPETGAQLTFISSLDVLAKFVSTLPNKNDENQPQVEYTVTAMGKSFVARANLPDTAPIQSVSGEPQRGKQLARCSAAFTACVELVQKKFLDGHLQPVFTKHLPAMRNARLAISSNKKAEYAMRVKPSFWLSHCPGSQTELFTTLLALDKSDQLQRPCQPLIMLTRQPLPIMSPIPMYFGNGETSMLRLSASQSSTVLSTGEKELLATFTLRVFADVFSKIYEAEVDEMPYFVAPCDMSSLASGEAHIDWNVLNDVKENKNTTWENAPDDFFHGKLAIDPWDGSRKFILGGINKELKPSDPPPKYAPVPKSRAYRAGEQNIKEYSNSLTLQSRKRRQWRDDQPVVNAELLSLRRNFLDEFFVEEDANRKCCVILEPLDISPIPVDIVAMALTLPVIIYRIDSILISLEACSILDIAIAPDLALEAMTKDSFNTEEHGAEQVGFQAGMGRNYERLELLGDSFLKMATTISIFTIMPGGDEFEYHVERMLMICNKNLFNHAVDRKIQEHVRSKAFDRRTWYPNMKLNKGKAIKTEARHCISDKSIADVCEALIGAAYLTGPDDDLDMAVRAVSAVVGNKSHKMTRFSDYYDAFHVPKWHIGPSTAAQRLAVDRIAENVGYRFQSPTLLRSAFKHPSYVFESIPDYQRLEFLGDALLDMTIVDHLFKRFPDADPQWLTEHKMAMVSNQFLGCLCVKLKLHKHLLIGTSPLLGFIQDYAVQLEQAEECARLEIEDLNGKDCGDDDEARIRSFWLNVPHPPKALADALEALIGAMFVDSKYDYSVVQDFFTTWVQPYFQNMELYDKYASNHPVTAVTHRLQQDLGCQKWTMCVSAVPLAVEMGVSILSDNDVLCALMIHEKVVEHATARSGSDAKAMVAKMALGRFEKLTRKDFREVVGCDCE